eukprot:13266686-Alexandrium_andersonii.AAC.1
MHEFHLALMPPAQLASAKAVVHETPAEVGAAVVPRRPSSPVEHVDVDVVREPEIRAPMAAGAD